MKNIVILISGGGSNMAAIARVAKKENWQQKHGVRIAAVISNKAEAAGLALAGSLGIEAEAVPHRDFASRGVFDAALMARIDLHAPRLVVLAGFMRILTPGFIADWRGRMLNIHPSLLPKYPGLDTYARALAAGDAEAGCSVHVVTEALDDGPVIAQARVPVRAGDTPETLAARVLEAEHRL